jgi:hypothetical protein
MDAHLIAECCPNGDFCTRTIPQYPSGGLTAEDTTYGDGEVVKPTGIPRETGHGEALIRHIQQAEVLREQTVL